MKKTVMRSYAKLIVRVGANVQKGQEVRVFASLDQPEFIKMLDKCTLLRVRTHGCTSFLLVTIFRHLLDQSDP